MKKLSHVLLELVLIIPAIILVLQEEQTTDKLITGLLFGVLAVIASVTKGA